MMELTNSAIADMRHVVTTFSSVLLGRPVSEEAPLATLDCILLASAGLSLAMARNACPDLFAHDCVVPEALPAFTGGIAGPTSCDGLCVKTMVDAIWVARASADAASSARTRVAASAPAQDPAGDSLASGFATRAATLSSGLGPAGGGSASCHPIRVTSSPVQGSAGDDLASGSATREATGSPGSGATGNGSVSCDAARAAGHPPALAAPAGPAGHTPRCRVCGDPSNSSNNCAAQDLSNSVVPPDTHLFGCFTIASIGRRFMGCPDVGLNHVLEYARHLEEMNACNPLGHRVEYPEGAGNGCFVVSADLANIGMLFDPTDASEAYYQNNGPNCPRGPVWGKHGVQAGFALSSAGKQNAGFVARRTLPPSIEEVFTRPSNDHFSRGVAMLRQRSMQKQAFYAAPAHGGFPGCIIASCKGDPGVANAVMGHNTVRVAGSMVPTDLSQQDYSPLHDGQTATPLERAIAIANNVTSAQLWMLEAASPLCFIPKTPAGALALMTATLTTDQASQTPSEPQGSTKLLWWLLAIRLELTGPEVASARGELYSQTYVELKSLVENCQETPYVVQVPHSEQVDDELLRLAVLTPGTVTCPGRGAPGSASHTPVSRLGKRITAEHKLTPVQEAEGAALSRAAACAVGTGRQLEALNRLVKWRAGTVKMYPILFGGLELEVQELSPPGRRAVVTWGDASSAAFGEDALVGVGGTDGPTAAEVVTNHADYASFMSIANHEEKASLTNYVCSIESSRGGLSMDHEMVAGATDKVMANLLLGAQERAAKLESDEDAEQQGPGIRLRREDEARTTPVLQRAHDQPERLQGCQATQAERIQTSCSAGNGSGTVLVVANGLEGSVILGVSTIGSMVWLVRSNVNVETATAALWMGGSGLHALMGAPAPVVAHECPLLFGANALLVGKFEQLLSSGKRTDSVLTDETGNPTVRMVCDHVYHVADLLDGFREDARLDALLKMCVVADAFMFVSPGGPHTVDTALQFSSNGAIVHIKETDRGRGMAGGDSGASSPPAMYSPGGCVPVGWDMFLERPEAEDNEHSPASSVSGSSSDSEPEPSAVVSVEKIVQKIEDGKVIACNIVPRVDALLKSPEEMDRVWGAVSAVVRGNSTSEHANAAGPGLDRPAQRLLKVMERFTGSSPLVIMAELVCAALAGDDGLGRMQTALQAVAQDSGRPLDLEAAVELLSGATLLYTVNGLDAVRRAREKLLAAVREVQLKMKADAAAAARTAADVACSAAFFAHVICECHPNSPHYPSSIAMPPVGDGAGTTLVYTLKCIGQGGRRVLINNVWYNVFGSVAIAECVVRDACRSAADATASASKASDDAVAELTDKLKATDVSFRMSVELSKKKEALEQRGALADRDRQVWNQVFYGVPVIGLPASPAELGKCVLPATEAAVGVLADESPVPGRDEFGCGVYNMAWDQRQVTQLVAMYKATLGPDITSDVAWYNMISDRASDYRLLATSVLHKVVQALFGRNSNDESSEASKLVRAMYPVTSARELEVKSARELAEPVTIKFLDGEFTREDLAGAELCLTTGLVGLVMATMSAWVPGSKGSEDLPEAEALADMLDAVRLGSTAPYVSLLSSARLHPQRSADGEPLLFHQRAVTADDLVQAAHMNQCRMACWRRDHYSAALLCAGVDAEERTRMTTNYFCHRGIKDVNFFLEGMTAASDTSDDEESVPAGDGQLPAPPPCAPTSASVAAIVPAAPSGVRPQLPSDVGDWVKKNGSGEQRPTSHTSRSPSTTKPGLKNSATSAVKDEAHRGRQSHFSHHYDRRHDGNHRGHSGFGDRGYGQRQGYDQGPGHGARPRNYHAMMPGHGGTNYYDSRPGGANAGGHRVHHSRLGNFNPTYAGADHARGDSGYMSSGSASSGNSIGGARDSRHGKRPDAGERDFGGGGPKRKSNPADMDAWQRNRQEQLKEEREGKRSSSTGSPGDRSSKRPKGIGSGPVGCCKDLCGEYVALRQYDDCAPDVGAQWVEYCDTLVHMPLLCPTNACADCAIDTVPRSLTLSNAQRSDLVSLLPTSADPNMYPFFMQGPTNEAESKGESSADAWGRKAPWVTHETWEGCKRMRSVSASEHELETEPPAGAEDGQPGGTPQKGPGPPADCNRQNMSPAGRIISLNTINSRRTPGSTQSVTNSRPEQPALISPADVPSRCAGFLFVNANGFCLATVTSGTVRLGTGPNGMTKAEIVMETVNRLADQGVDVVFIYVSETWGQDSESPLELPSFIPHARVRSWGKNGGATGYVAEASAAQCTMIDDLVLGKGECHLECHYTPLHGPPVHAIADYFESDTATARFGYCPMTHLRLVGERIARAQALYGSADSPCVVLAGGDYNMAHGSLQEDPDNPRSTFGTADERGTALSKMMTDLGMLSANGRFGRAEATRWDTRLNMAGREIDYIWYWTVGCERVKHAGMEPFNKELSDHRLLYIAVKDAGSAALDATTVVPERTGPAGDTKVRQERWEDPQLVNATLRQACTLFGDMKRDGLPLNQGRWEATARELCAPLGNKASTQPGATAFVQRRGKLLRVSRHGSVWWHALLHDSGYHVERHASRTAAKIAYDTFVAAGESRASLAAARELARVGTELAGGGRVQAGVPAYLARLQDPTPPTAPAAPDSDIERGSDLVHQVWECSFADGTSEALSWHECLAVMDSEVESATEPCEERAHCVEASACAKRARDDARTKASALATKRKTAQIAFVTERILRILSFQKCHGGIMTGIKEICEGATLEPPPTIMRNKVTQELVNGEAAVAQAFGPDHLATIAALPPANGETATELAKAALFAAAARKCSSKADWVELLAAWKMPAMDERWYDWINRPFTTQEVVKSMSGAKWNTSYGDDGVPTNLMIILAACPACVELLTAWAQRIHDGEDMPPQWKRQMIKMLHKKGGSKLLPDSYRGITLLLGVLKMFEGLYTFRAYQMTYARHLIHHSQGGFMRHHACTDLHQQWFIMLEIAGEIAAVDGDQWKCYPTIPSHVETWRLAWKGFHGPFHNCLQRMNDDRVSFVVVGKSRSADFPQLNGSSEGARRAPLLFALLADASAREMNRQLLGVRTLGKLEAMLRWADDDRYFSSGVRASIDLQRALAVIDRDMICRNQYNSAEKTVAHSNVSSTSVTSSQARSSRQHQLKTLVMYCLRGGQKRADALKPEEEWEAPDAVLDAKYPDKAPHFRPSNKVDVRKSGYKDAYGADTVPALRLQQVHSQKWLGIWMSSNGMLIDQIQAALARGRTLRGRLGSLVVISGMMPFSAMAACAQALFVGRVLHGGIVWCCIGMPRDRMYTPRPTAVSSIDGCHLDFACALTGLNRSAGAAMLLNETGWSPPWLHVCRAMCMEWWRVRNFEDTRVLKHFLITLVGKLVVRLNTWLLCNTDATDKEVACFTGSEANSSSMVLDNPGGEDHVVDPRDLVSARRYIWAAHMIFGRTGHRMLTAAHNGDLWYGPKDGWIEAVNLAYQARCRKVHKADMYDAGFATRTGREDGRAPMSRRNLNAGATLGLPFIVRVANRHLAWSQSIALALVRMVKCGTIMTNHKQAVINSERRAQNAERRARKEPETEVHVAAAQCCDSHRCAHRCGQDDETLGETAEHMIFKCGSMQHFTQPFLSAVQGARGMPRSIVQGLCDTDTSVPAETRAMDAFLCLVNGGRAREGVPAAALCRVIPTLFAMLIGIFRAHPYYAARKYNPPFADRLAMRYGVSLELAQPTEARAPVTAPVSEAGGSSSAGSISGACSAIDDAHALSAQARPQAAHAHGSGGSRAEPADGTS